MTFATRLTKVGNGREHFDQRTRMCYHKVPPSERVVAQVGNAGQAKPHREHNPLSLLGARLATPIRKLNDPVPTWRFQPVVEALQALQGVQCTVAVTTVAALGDLTRC